MLRTFDRRLSHFSTTLGLGVPPPPPSRRVRSDAPAARGLTSSVAVRLSVGMVYDVMFGLSLGRACDSMFVILSVGSVSGGMFACPWAGVCNGMFVSRQGLHLTVCL